MRRNLWEAIKETRIDPAVGIGIAKLVESDKVSAHVALVEREVKAHYHKERDEVYIILRGRGLLRVGDEEFEVKEGDVILIPRGKVHSLKRLGDEPVVLMFVSSPPFAPEIDRFFV